MSKAEFIRKLKDGCKHEWQFVTSYIKYDWFQCRKCGEGKEVK